MSLHFRGPLTLKQVAVYTPGSSSKSKARRASQERRHGHAAFHKREKEVREVQDRAEAEKRKVGDTVTATINGQVVHWVNEYAGPAAATPTPAAAAAAAAPAAPAAAGYIATDDKSNKGKGSQGSSSSKPVAAGDWARIAYYDSDSQTAEGLTWLNNMGGAGSGTFDK